MLDTGSLKAPQIGWNEVRWERPAAVLEGLAGATAFYHVHSFVAVPAAARGRAGHCRVRRAFRFGRRRTARSWGSSFIPRSHRTTACDCSPTGSPRATVARDPLSGDRHPRRARRAPRPGRFRPRHEYAADPLDAARAWAAAGAQRLHVVDLDGARSGAPVNLEARGSASSLRRASRSRFGGGLRSARGDRRGVRGGRRARRAGHRRVRRRRAAGRRAGRARRADRGIGRRARRHGLDGGLDADRVARRSRGRARARLARRAQLRLHRRGSRRHAGRARPGRRGGGRRRRSRASCSTRAGSGRSSDLEALVALRHPRLAGVIAGKALYERRFTSRRRRRRCASEAGDPVPGRGRRPRRQGHALRRHPRRR